MKCNRNLVVRRRDVNGQALVEGVVALALIVATTVGALLLLANTAIAFYFKDKLASASNQAAQFAFTLPNGSNVNQQTTEFVKFFLPKIGVKPNNLTVRTTIDRFQGRDAVFVTITNTFPLFGNVDFLPGTVRLTDDGGAIFPTIAVAGAGPAGPPGPAGPAGPSGAGGGAVGFLQMPTNGNTLGRGVPKLFIPIARIANDPADLSAFDLGIRNRQAELTANSAGPPLYQVTSDGRTLNIPATLNQAAFNANGNTALGAEIPGFR